MFNVANAIAAVPREEQVPLIGHLVWYTISECLINRDDLRQHLRVAGLDERHMPPEIRPSDAFRKATKMLEQKLSSRNENAGRCNFLVRETAATKDEIERRLVVETVDAKNRQLNYDAAAAVMTLDKKTGSFSFYAAETEFEGFCSQAAAEFEVLKTHHDSRAIRSMIYSALSGMAPVIVRPSGGVYFVPVQFQDELKKLVEFIRLLGQNSEGWMMPVMDQADMRDMVRLKVKEHLEGQVSLMARTIKESHGKGDILAALEQGKSSLKSFSEYQKALNEELGEMKELTSLIARQMQTLVELAR